MHSFLKFNKFQRIQRFLTNLKTNKFFSPIFKSIKNITCFFYQQKFIDIDRIEPFIHILYELDTKQRKIRSLRGFFLYALEIIENGKDYEILKTNLQPSFWRKLKTILRQNKKIVLLQFLFGSQDSIAGLETQNHLNEKIETLQNQVNSLQDRIRDLETTLENSKYALSDALEAPNAIKIIQQGDSILKGNNDPYWEKNHQDMNRPDNLGSNVLSEASKIDFKTLSNTQQYNIPSNQKKGLTEATQRGNQSNFITLGKISEQEKIEIIQTGFQRQAEGKISLKKYYEGTEIHSLFQSKGYSIKYETIRRTKLYQTLKE